MAVNPCPETNLVPGAMHSGTPLFSIGGTIRVRGAVDFNLLEAAIHRFISMNDGIRLRITVHSTEPAQYISDAPATLLDRMDFSSEEHPEYAFRRWVEAEARKPFQLTGEPLFYFALFSLGDQDCGYFVKLHHIIADGWSTHIMTEQITDSYEQMLKGLWSGKRGVRRHPTLNISLQRSVTWSPPGQRRTSGFGWRSFASCLNTV